MEDSDDGVQGDKIFSDNESCVVDCDLVVLVTMKINFNMMLTMLISGRAHYIFSLEIPLLCLQSCCSGVILSVVFCLSVISVLKFLYHMFVCTVLYIFLCVCLLGFRKSIQQFYLLPATVI